MIQRKMTRPIHIGPVQIGGGAPVSVQSMTNTKTTDTKSTVAQIRALQAAGCDIVRLAVPDMDAAKNLGNIIQSVTVPLVADIHRPRSDPSGHSGTAPESGKYRRRRTRQSGCP